MPPFLDVYHRLLDAFGPQHWWPGNSPFEVMVGAILVQNTAWKNVERAISNLREGGLLAPQPLYELPENELCELIRPAGYYRLKAGRLRNLLRLIVEEYNGDSMALLDSNAQTLREKLLSVKGIGPETADSILLYAAGKPSFVIDTYTHRVLIRHGWIGDDADYYQMKDLFELGLPQDVALYNEYHALLVRVGHLYCRRTPRCTDCPLRGMLPDGAL
ncbi:MAG: endonuclease III domain-containing protein [Pirellulales bacterium]|nr:endonuclease III domain-containing protein [Pirellulales bacterium]